MQDISKILLDIIEKYECDVLVALILLLNDEGV